MRHAAAASQDLFTVITEIEETSYQKHIKNTLSYNHNTVIICDVIFIREYHYYEAMCRTRRRATVCHIRNSNADLILLSHSQDTLQYNPFVFVEDFAKPQIAELDVDKSADVLYIHIMVEEQRSRIEYATDARGSCGATEGGLRRAARAPAGGSAGGV